MDGISVAASVFGLIQAASATACFISSFKDSPSLASAVHREASALSAICLQMHDFLCHKVDELSQERGNMIFVEQVITTVTGLMCAFSELKSLLGGLLEDGEPDWEQLVGMPLTMQPSSIRVSGGRVWNRAKWANKEKSVQKVLENLRLHKESLTLILTISTCNSNIEARSQMRELKNNITELLESNATLVATINKLKCRAAAQASLGAVSERDAHSISINNSIRASISGRSSPLSLHSDHSDHSASSQRSKSSFPFSVIEEILHKSRPYARLVRRGSMSTLKTVVTATSSWTELEGLSVSQVSKISLFRIPFRREELQNSECYTCDAEGGSYSADISATQRSELPRSFADDSPTNFPLQGDRAETGSHTERDFSSVLKERYRTWCGDVEETKKIKRELSHSRKGVKDKSFRISAPIKSINSLWTFYNPENDLVSISGEKARAQLPEEYNQNVSMIENARNISSPLLQALPEERTGSVRRSSKNVGCGLMNTAKVYGSAEYEYVYCTGCGQALEENKEFKLAGDAWHIECLRRRELLRLDGLLSDNPPTEDEEVAEEVLVTLESLFPPQRDGDQSTGTSSFSSISSFASTNSDYPLETETPATSVSNSAQPSPHHSPHARPKDKLRPESPVLDHHSTAERSLGSDVRVTDHQEPCKQHAHECHGCGWYLDKQLLSINYRGCHWHVDCFSQSQTNAQPDTQSEPKLTQQEGRVLQEIADRLCSSSSKPLEHVPSLGDLQTLWI